MMSKKHWIKVGGAVACLPFATLQAAPWVDSNDPRARFNIQQLADQGHLNRTVTTWPLMWSTVESGLAESLGTPSRQRQINQTYLRLLHQKQTAPGMTTSLSLAGVTEPTFIRGFYAAPREVGELSLRLEWQSDFWAVGVNPILTVDPEDDESFRLDGSYLAVNLSNWTLGAGSVDRWWGPGWQSSLILSNNARPVPAVWLTRRDARSFELPLLNWLGPWQLTTLLGQLEQERHIPEAKFFGMRFTFRPVQGLDIGLTRTLQIGGEGRSESASTFFDAFIGRDNPSNNDVDPSNQLGAVDFRYGFQLGENTMGVYGQMMGEDEAGGFPSRKSWLFGIDWTSQLIGHQQQWFIEGSDTLADNLLGGAIPDISYEHRVYRSGYRYRGRNMASTFEGDSQAITAGVFNFLPDGRHLGLALSWLDLRGKGPDRVSNPDPSVQYYVPGKDQELVVITASYRQPLPVGTLDISAQLSDKELVLIGEELSQWSLGASWQITF